jgi:uncharacterized membrane protein HdeD (DUF308 family)
MPKNVSLFEKLWYTSLVISTLVIALDFQYLAGLKGAGYIIIIQLLVIGVAALLTWLAARKRQGWVRWLLLISFIIVLPSFILLLGGKFERNVFMALLSIFKVFLQTAALYFLFTGDSAAWFTKERSTP